MLRITGRKVAFLVALAFGLVSAIVISSSPASAGGSGGYGGSYCGSGSPSGVGQLSYFDNPSFSSDLVYTADAQNCSTTVQVNDVVKSTSGHIVTYTAATGVTFSYANVSVSNPYDFNQSAYVNIPLQSGATTFSYNIDDLPAFVYHAPAKNGKKGKTSYVRKVTGVYVSGSDANYPAPPQYTCCG